MAIESDIQKLNPGQLVDLFELDTASIGGDIVRWHGGVNGLGNDVVWQGKTYSRFPVEASGFAKSSKGAMARPSIRVANVSGLIGAMARELGDLLGAKVTRRRTFAKYLDEVNFLPVTLDSPAFVSRASIGTYFDLSGVLRTAGVNVARYDYDPITYIPKGLLIESAATNLLTYSEQFDSAAWDKRLTTIVPDAMVSPDGSMTADKLCETAASNFPEVRKLGFPVTAGVPYVLSAYVKASERSVAYLYPGFGGGAVFDLVSGVYSGYYTGGSAPIAYGISDVGNGWYRIWIRLTPTSSSIIPTVGMRNASGNFTSPYVGTAGAGLYVWGVQLEAGSLSSYIPTTGAAVARAADITTMTAPGNPSADPNVGFPDEIWFVDRKAAENGVYVEFELAAAFDVAGVQLPRRQYIQNVCAWRYRSAECGYAGGAVADGRDAATSSLEQDQCGKRLASCKLRFGAHGALPFGGYPGTGLIR